MNNDAELWKGIMHGDKEMFLALYQKYYHSLLFIGLKEIKDAHLVKDAIQQQFLYLWEKRETISEAQNVKSYLITSFLRKLTSDWKKSEKASNLQVVWNNNVEDYQPTPEESLIRKDDEFHLCKIVLEHVNALPTRQRELIMLKFYEGQSYEEIVQKTGLTHRTVYNKIHEALKKLKLDMDRKQHSYIAMLLMIVCFIVSSSFTLGHH